jgi:hypothetical protein
MVVGQQSKKDRGAELAIYKRKGKTGVNTVGGKCAVWEDVVGRQQSKRKRKGGEESNTKGEPDLWCHRPRLKKVGRVGGAGSTSSGPAVNLALGSKNYGGWGLYLAGGV